MGFDDHAPDRRTSDDPPGRRVARRGWRRQALTASVLTGMLLVGPGCSEREAGLDDLLAALERTETSYLGLSRLEFVAALENRLDRLRRVCEHLRDREGGPTASDLAAVDDLHAEIREELLELKLDDDAEDWKEAREALVAKARRLEDEVLRRVAELPS